MADASRASARGSLPVVRIVASVPLDEGMADRLATKFAARCGLTEYTTHVELDSELIGGLVIFAGGFRYDYSIQGQLSRIAASLRSTRPQEGPQVEEAALSDFIAATLGESLENFTETPVADITEIQSAYLRQMEGGGTLDPDSIRADLRESISRFEATSTVEEVSVVATSGDGIVTVPGLKNCMYGEIIEFESGADGFAMNLEEDRVGIVLLSGAETVTEGMMCKRTGRTIRVPVGSMLLGRVVDPLGKPLDGLGPIQTISYREIESPAPSVVDRQGVNKSLQTGITAIDALTPIGRGQRELLIGDRQTGKTAIAIDTILNQKGKGVQCIYVAIGQKMSTIASVVGTLNRAGAMDYTTVVVASASASAAMQYIAPYSGCAIAEDFMYNANADVLIVYDDLTKHAQAYRAISLLLRRPPGREAFPGDVFYLHSRLLERAARLSDELGGGSITALPIVETQGGDISAYIPTNVISITDGQIYLESELFFSGRRPAVNVGLSVSRVGSDAQEKAMKKVAGPLRINLAQYRELEVFSQFGSELDASTRAQLATGERITEVLKQRQFAPRPLAEQVVMVYVATQGMLSDIDADATREFLKGFLEFLGAISPNVMNTILETGDLGATFADDVQSALKEYKQIWRADRGSDGTEL
jgi:F-type H+/Na+-transporting ATPase subunit alpha